MAQQDTLRVRVARVVRETGEINSYELVPADGGELPAWDAGSHLDVALPSGQVRPYSLCNDPAERHRYVIAVKREDGGRGGSLAMHQQVREGTVLAVSLPRNAFRLQPGEGPVVLVAGGIGLTPLLAMAHTLKREGRPFTLHVCTRTPEATAFHALLASPEWAPHVRLHHTGGEPGRRADLRALLAGRPDGAHLYCCGSTGLMRAVREAALEGGWPEAAVHFESFSAEPLVAPVGGADDTFEVVVQSTGQVLPVPAGTSLLNALSAAGVMVPSSCESGVCGTCQTNVLEGEADHRDSFLTDEEKQGGKCMLVCVSRARSRRLTLDL
jgi:vanillate O-demethylase ferredoxin subunit